MRPGGARRAAGVVAALLLAACSHPDRTDARPLRVGVAAFGAVDPLADVGELARLGCDYIEPALSKLAALPAADLARARERVQAAGLRAETMNWFVPGELKLTGPEVDDVRVQAYVERALAIAASFGTEVIVFGSPGARSYPDGFPRAQAWQQLVAFLRTCAAVVARNGHGIVIGIEALRRPESNIVNSVGEAVALARAVDRPQVGIVVDFYHLTFENEDPDVVLAAGDRIVHVQIADPQARGFPRSAAGEPRYARFFAALRRIGYRGRISVEAVAADLAVDVPASLSWLRGIAVLP